jgi:protein TonB
VTSRAPRTVDALFLLVAMLAHAGLALGVFRTQPRARRPPDFVELAMSTPRPTPPPPAPEPAKPAPPKPAPPARILPREAAPKPMAPPPPAVNVEPPKERPSVAPAPVFGVTMDSTAPGDTSFAVPAGNTTMIDPRSRRAKAAPSAPAVRAETPRPRASRELDVKTMPEIDSDACGRMIVYPREAEQLGIEGDVKLRVALDERGRVVRVDVLSGPGHGLEQAAAHALEHKCKFTPAIAGDGTPVPFVISAYTFHFEVPQ